jgi:hypothetical protein
LLTIATKLFDSLYLLPGITLFTVDDYRFHVGIVDINEMPNINGFIFRQLSNEEGIGVSDSVTTDVTNADDHPRLW